MVLEAYSRRVQRDCGESDRNSRLKLRQNSLRLFGFPRPNQRTVRAIVMMWLIASSAARILRDIDCSIRR